VLRLRRYLSEICKGHGEKPAGIGIYQRRVPGLPRFHGLLLLCGTQVLAAGDSGDFLGTAAPQNSGRQAREQKLDLTTRPRGRDTMRVRSKMPYAAHRSPR
jgi:hypothetical protein